MIVHRCALAACIAASAGVAFPHPAWAATVMDFPEQKVLKDQIQVASYSFQRSAPPLARVCTGAGGGGSFTITKPVDATSPQLADAMKAKSGSVVQLDDTKADGSRVAFQFTNAVIGSIKPAQAGDAPMEAVSFTYSKVQWLTVGCDPPPLRERAGRDIAPAAPSYGGGGYGNGY